MILCKIQASISYISNSWLWQRGLFYSLTLSPIPIEIMAFSFQFASYVQSLLWRFAFKWRQNDWAQAPLWPYKSLLHVKLVITVNKIFGGRIKWILLESILYKIIIPKDFLNIRNIYFGITKFITKSWVNENKMSFSRRFYFMFCIYACIWKISINITFS